MNGRQNVILHDNVLPKQQTTIKFQTNKPVTKTLGLKRVSFGSSKGSMVETVHYEASSPLSQTKSTEPEPEPEPESNLKSDIKDEINSISSNGSANKNSINHCITETDNKIEKQEESDRLAVRVSFFQSSAPQEINRPFDYFSITNHNFDTFTDMTESTIDYHRQMSNDSGWDNPFRPDGDLSREADVIVSMIKGGKPITPSNESANPVNGVSHNSNTEIGDTVLDGAIKKDKSQLQSGTAQNGTKSPQNKQTTISNQVIPGPTSASHVVIEEKKKKKCTCCVIQ